ncbi:MAG: outer membrane protein assembly factor [Bacillota bacterium]
MKLFGRTRALIVVMLILCLGMAFVIPAMAETNPTVMTFEVQGNPHVPSEKILGVISNTKIGEPMDPRMVQLDMQAIMSLGYFSDVRVSTEKMLDGVKVIFEVVENPLFQELRISGLTKIKPEELQSFFTQKPGEIFNTVTFKEDLSKALKFCQEKKGFYVQPKAGGNLGISSDGIVNLELTELRLGKIKILGLVKTKEIVVRRELSIKEGDIIDTNLLKDEYLTLMRLRLFDGLDMRFEQSETPNSLDLILEAKEAQTGSFSFGFSYSETTQEFGGLLGYSEANLMGMGQSMSLDLNISGSSRNLQFSFQEPWLDNNHTSFGLSMWNAESSITSRMNSWYPDNYTDHSPTDLYNMNLLRTGLSLTLGRELLKDINGNLSLNFEKNTVKSFWKDGTDQDTNPSLTIDNPKNPLEFWDNSVGLGLVQNKLSYQDRNFVDGGYRLSLDNTWAGRYLGGTFDYYKVTADGRWFHAFTPNLVFGTRLQGSEIMGNYPDYDALYLGGMFRLRGYDDRRYADNHGEQLIGNEYLLSNTELRYRMPSNKNLEFVLFYDIGQMTNAGAHNIKSDYGVGLRYNIPFLGVIRLDQAWNVDGDARLVFSLGEIF